MSAEADVSNDRLDTAARVLAACRLEQRLFDGFTEELRPRSEEEAYAVQGRLHGLLTSAGEGDLVGHKIGCTTEVMQQYLGIDNPCAGQLFSHRVFQGEGTFPQHRSGRLGVECEVAVILGSDIDPREDRFTRQDVGPAVAACCAAIEVVEDRYVDYTSLDTPTLIADDFFNSGAVLGPLVDGFDVEALPTVNASMSVDSVEVGRGLGTQVMGHPLDALAWLATSCSSRGITLRAGEIVLLGSLVQTHWIAPGSTVEIANDQLGQAVAHLT
jgi:2-keto-4-pentenoate hydratase